MNFSYLAFPKLNLGIAFDSLVFTTGLVVTLIGLCFDLDIGFPMVFSKLLKSLGT